MKLTSPFTIVGDALEGKALQSTTCFIDETEVAPKECGVPIEEKTEDLKLDSWDEEFKEYPTNSHGKVIDE